MIKTHDLSSANMRTNINFTKTDFMKSLTMSLKLWHKLLFAGDITFFNLQIKLFFINRKYFPPKYFLFKNSTKLLYLASCSHVETSKSKLGS